MNVFLSRFFLLTVLYFFSTQTLSAQVTIYEQNFDGNNGTFSNAILSEITPNNSWLASSTAAQYANYRHLWNISNLGTGSYQPITGRSLGIGFYNANSPFTANRPFQTWSGTNCSVIPPTYRWAYVPISTVGFENIQVEFKWRCSGELDAGVAYDYGTVNTSINGGSTWLLDQTGGVGGTTGADGTYTGGLYLNNTGVQTQIINLPATRDNQANFVLAFRMVVDECYGTGGGFIVDDIIVTGTPIGGCAGGTTSPSYQFAQTNTSATVSVSGYSGANIQWQVSPNGSTGWANVSGGSGANTDTYTTALLSNGSYFYRAVISDVSCSENSTTAEVLVAAEPVYCNGAGIGNSFLNNHIEDVGFHEWSDPNPGYVSNNYLDYSDTTTYGYATVVAGQYHHFNATIRANGTGTASTTVAAWIDFNGDGVFDNTSFSSGGELLDIVNFSSTVGNTYAVYFTVPASVSGLKRIRLRALRGNFATIDPCGNYTNSQTKDFTIKVLPTIGSQVCGVVNGNADNVSTNSTTDKVNISRVLVEGPSGTLIDNNGQFFGVQAGSTITMYNYSNMMGAYSNGLTLEAGQNYTVTIEHSGYTCAAGLFIDYNGDGSFGGANELVGRLSDPNANPFIFNFTVPSGVTDGLQVAMRVRLRYDASANLGGVINACNNISDGLGQYSEVEDYRAMLLSPSLVCDIVSNLDASIGAPANGLNHHLDFSWSALSGATNYDVETSTDGITFGGLQNVTTTTFDFDASDQPNVPFWFRVRARDASQVCAWTPVASPIYTACDLPATPDVTNATSTTLDVALVPESPVANPTSTTYSLICSTTGEFVQSDGTLGATEIFQTSSAWSTITVTGLNTETEYCFVAKARNEDGDLRGGINSVSGLETFTTNVLNTTGGSGPNNVWWSPSSCTTGGMVYFASGGCADGNVGFDGSFNSFYGCFLRSPTQNCTGLNSVIMTFDLSNSYFATQPNDRVYFNMWAPTSGSPGGGYIAAAKVNGVSTDQLYFSQLRNCEAVEVEFDLSSVTDKSAILFYLNAACGYNNSNLYSVRFDNISILEGSPGMCLSTLAAPFPDLIVESITPSIGTLCGSGSVTYDVVVKNDGLVDIPAATSFDVQASVGNLVCGVNTQTQSYSLGLASGASTTLNFTLPLTTSSDVSFLADAANTIVEGNESNNCLSDNSVIISNGLSGTYTIQSGGDYTTIASAVADLNSQGVCGPVVFDITGIFTENAIINSISGASAINTITFRSADSNPANAVIQQSGNAYTFDLFGAQYIIFDNVTIRYTGTSTSYGAVRFRTNADNNTIRNSILSGITTSTSTANAGAVIYAAETSAANDCSGILIENCSLSGGTHGIFMDMSSSDPAGPQILNNTIVNFNRGRGIYITDHTSTTIHGNTITNDQTGGATSYGISVNGGVGPHQITSNYIYTTDSGRFGYGIYLGSPSAIGNSSLCANNSIQLQNTTSNAYGIDQPSTTGTNWDILNNTVYISGGTSANTFCYRTFGLSSGDESRILNNIFINASSNTGTTGNQTVQINNANSFSALDYNCYWTVNNGTPFRGDYVSGYTTFASFIAATGETNSINIDPEMTFVSGIGWKAEAAGIVGAGLMQASVTDDIDGNLRQNPPSIGSHEVSVTCPPPSITYSVDDVCPDASQFVVDYTSTANSPITYSIVTVAPALPGFTPVSGETLPAAPNSLAIALPASPSPGSYGFTITVSSAGCSSTALPFTLDILNQTVGEWLGYTSAWETPSNWACNTLPDITTNVVIPTSPLGGNQPEVNSVGIALANNLSIQSTASLSLQPGADLEIHGDFLNNGIASLGAGSIYIAGSSLQTIGGATISTFYNLIIQSLISIEAIKLSNDINLQGTLTMNQGKFNLDDYSVFLGSTGVVQNESNDRRIYGAAGELKSERVLAANSTYNNIAGMGVSITTGSNAPGPTQIDRGHVSQQAGVQNNSIQRYFDISPTLNSALDATLKIEYFDDEMIDVDAVNPNEADLIPWRSEDNGNTWEGQFVPAQISRDLAANWVQQTGIPAFSRWTLSDWETEPLPITLIDFQANEDDGAVYLNWTTASEINNDYFTVERSSDAIEFTDILRQNGAGNSATILNYTDIDLEPLRGVSYYRLKQTDFDGTESFSNAIAVNIKTDYSDLGIHRVNSDVINLSWELDTQERFKIDLFDARGRHMVSETKTISTGSSQSLLNHGELPPGIYIIRAVGNKGNVFVRKIHLN
jgi:hypothetical protein